VGVVELPDPGVRLAPSRLDRRGGGLGRVPPVSVESALRGRGGERQERLAEGVELVLPVDPVAGDRRAAGAAWQRPTARVRVTGVAGGGRRLELRDALGPCRLGGAPELRGRSGRRVLPVAVAVVEHEDKVVRGALLELEPEHERVAAAPVGGRAGGAAPGEGDRARPPAPRAVLAAADVAPGVSAEAGAHVELGPHAGRPSPRDHAPQDDRAVRPCSS
jgi:hypothetical protein